MTDDPLEELKMIPPHLDDDGFTLRVMAALPPRRRELRPWFDVATVAALALAAALGAPELIGAATGWLADAALRLPGNTPATTLAALAAAGGALLGGWWLAQGDQAR